MAHAPALIAALLLALPSAVPAQVIVSANDGKQILVEGVPTVPAKPLPDTVALIELVHGRPRIVGQVSAPTSVIGPPGSVAVSPDGRLALVSAARRIDPADPTRLIPDDVVSVIDLRARPIRATATLHAGAGASGVAINRAGTLALVANRSEGTVSVFAIAGGVVTPAGKVALGDASSGPSQAVFTADGRRALVTRDGDSRISVLDIDGDGRVTVEPRAIVAGVRPYGLDAAGRYAVAANMGGAATDVDAISLIDLGPGAPRVLDTVSVGLSPEGIRMSGDGRFVAVALHNGSGSPSSSPLHSERGRLQIWRVKGARLVKVTEAPMGRWAQGIVWSRDGKTLLVQAMADRRIEVFGFDGRRLKPRGAMATSPGPAGIGAAAP